MLDAKTGDLINKKALGIIPARYASTRFPGKPLVKILEKSLIQRTFENAKQCSSLSDIVIATDDQRVFDHVKSFTDKVVMTSMDCPTGTDRLAEVVKLYPQFRHFDLVVNIQGDEPCLDPSTVSLLIEALDRDSLAVISTPIALIKNPEDLSNPSVVKCVKTLDSNALYFSREAIPFCASSPIIHYRHIGIYAYRRDFLLKFAELPETPLQKTEDLEQLKALEHGFRIKVVLVNSQSIEVNHPEDIQKVELYLCTQNSSL